MEVVTDEINENIIEFLPDTHTYLVNGIITTSVTQLIHLIFPNKYKGIPPAVLNNAANRGTAIHKAIENYITKGEKPFLEELQDFIYLKDINKFEVLETEKVIVLIHNGIPLYVGRLDLIVEEEGKTILADIKTTSVLDMEYLSYQLSMYAVAYEQCYGRKIDGLKVIHLKNGKRQYKDVKRIETNKLIEEVQNLVEMSM